MGARNHRVSGPEEQAPRVLVLLVLLGEQGSEGASPRCLRAHTVKQGSHTTSSPEPFPPLKVRDLCPGHRESLSIKVKAFSMVKAY